MEATDDYTKCMELQEGLQILITECADIEPFERGRYGVVEFGTHCWSVGWTAGLRRSPVEGLRVTRKVPLSLEIETLKVWTNLRWH